MITGKCGIECEFKYLEEEKLLLVYTTGTNKGAVITHDWVWTEDDDLVESSFFYGLTPEKIVISEGVSAIGAYAFIGLETVSSLILPSSVRTIGDHAFHGCTNLRKIQYKHNNNNVSRLGIGAFAKCDKVDVNVFTKASDMDKKLSLFFVDEPGAYAFN